MLEKEQEHRPTMAVILGKLPLHMPSDLRNQKVFPREGEGKRERGGAGVGRRRETGRGCV